ncbi:hypothetical protein D7W81_17655 [Corallococcus aberystwythensis]|uniref:Uncharacterized protein n=1 Tax=Corallococcus aberystwythensis TaxID=2316722 RepID=A0A3A8QFD1_9BACT|nr:hypothetical protein D7W81_17655 [Corallococcus aberystwythensis]
MTSLVLSGCDTGTHTRLRFALNPSFLKGDSLAVAASGVRAMTTPPTLPNIQSGDGLSFQLEGASATVADIRLQLAGGLHCDDVREELPEGTGCVQSGDAPDTVTLAGPFSINLADGEPWGAELELPPGTYRRVDFVLGEGGFKAHTRLFQDSRLWDMNLTLPQGTALGFEATSDLAVKEGGSLRVTFTQDTWLKSLPLGACFQSGDLPRADSELLLDAASGACQGAADQVRDTIRARGAVTAHPF